MYRAGVFWREKRSRFHLIGQRGVSRFTPAPVRVPEDGAVAVAEGKTAFHLTKSHRTEINVSHRSTSTTAAASSSAQT
jgi:hypothetical protein